MVIYPDISILIGGLEHLDYFSIQLGMSSSQLTHIFQRGRSTTNQKRWLLLKNQNGTVFTLTLTSAKSLNFHLPPVEFFCIPLLPCEATWKLSALCVRACLDVCFLKNVGSVGLKKTSVEFLVWSSSTKKEHQKQCLFNQFFETA